MNSTHRLPTQLLPLLILLALANAILPAAFEQLKLHGISSSLQQGLGQSFIIWLSIVVAGWLWWQSPHSRQATMLPPTSWLLLYTLFSLLLVIPLATTAWLIAALLAIIWRYRYALDQYSRASAILLFALSIREPLSRLLLTLYSSEILNFDAKAASLLLEFSDQQFVIIGNLIVQENGYSLLILTGCSAFGNLSLALLLWLTLTLMQQKQLQRLDGVRAMAVVLLVIGLNALRLALMAQGPDWYSLLHEAHGASLHEACALASTLLCVRWRTAYENAANHTDHSITGTDTGSHRTSL